MNISQTKTLKLLSLHEYTHQMQTYCERKKIHGTVSLSHIQTFLKLSYLVCINLELRYLGLCKLTHTSKLTACKCSLSTLTKVFKASTLWANAFIESRCQSIIMYFKANLHIRYDLYVVNGVGFERMLLQSSFVGYICS